MYDALDFRLHGKALKGSFMISPDFVGSIDERIVLFQFAQHYNYCIGSPEACLGTVAYASGTLPPFIFHSCAAVSEDPL